jgi:hypothetical protein
VGLTYRATRAEQGELNSAGVNCIRFFPDAGIRVWGARTLAEQASEWRYINVRRLAEPPAAPTPLGPNPYKGLAAFDEDDAERFFGREALTGKLWEVLRALQAPVSASPPLRLRAVVGPSERRGASDIVHR